MTIFVPRLRWRARSLPQVSRAGRMDRYHPYRNRTWRLLPPDVADALVSYRSVDNRVRDRAVTHKGLKRPCVDSPCRQGVASSMAQHVSVDREWQLRSLAKPFYKLLSAVD